MNMTQNDMARMSRALRHRLRNSASGIKAAAALLAGQLDSRITPSEKEYFPLIAKECDSLAELASRLTQLLEGVGDGKTGQVGQILEQARQVVKGRYPLVDIRCHPEAVTVTGKVKHDACMVAALREVLMNAAEASPDRQVIVRCADAGNAVEIRVQDHGAGIPPEDWPGALEPFRASRVDHLGIGLAIATRSLAAIGGTLQAGKTEDGFCVILNLPIDRGN